MRRIAALAMLVTAATVAMGTSTPSEPPGGPGFEVMDTGGATPAPCGAVDTSGPFIRGGCSSQAHEFTTRLFIRTAFGAIPFGRCTINWNMHVDRTGRVWIDKVRIGGGSPCNDIRACIPDAVSGRIAKPTDDWPLSRAFPWRGRINDDDDGFAVRVDVCLDTCVGRYAGELDFGLGGGEGDWALKAVAAGVGDQSLQIDGEWDLDPGQFEIRRTGA